jgi:HEAT repeat protein
MAIDTSFALAFAAVGLLAALVLLVLAKRLVRGAAERRSRRRRVRWMTALGTGSVSDMRMGELRSLARAAARRRPAQEDLLALISAGRLPPRDERLAPFERALVRAGLQRSLRAGCSSRNAVERGRAALVWSGLGLQRAERTIARLTADGDPDVRAAAAQALATCATEDAAWALLRAMRDGQLDPQRVVERLTGDWAVAPLLTALHDPTFGHVKPWVAEALGLTGDARAEQPLMRVLAKGDESERIRACRALGRLGRETSSGPLVIALSDESAPVRAQAARALAQLRDERGVYALVKLLGDPSWWVRARAAEALGALGGPGLAALRWCAQTHADPYARERALEALAHVVGEAEGEIGAGAGAEAAVA